MALSPQDLSQIEAFMRQRLVAKPLPPTNQEAGLVTANEGLNTPAITLDGVKQPKLTMSPMTLGPPKDAAVGDLWIATGISTNNGATTVDWQFCFDGTVWRFVGGPPQSVFTNSFASVGAVTTWTAMNPGITAIRNGVYHAEFMGRGYLNSAATTDSFWVAIGFNGVAGLSNGIQYANLFTAAGASIGINANGVGSVNAGQNINLAMYATNANIQGLGQLDLTPIYVT